MALIAPLLAVTITSFLAIILARAAWHKADRFLETVGFAQGYGLVPDHWAAPIIRALTVIETLAVLALLAPPLRPLGSAMAAALFAGYGLLMAVALLNGRDRIDCGCGGAPQIVSRFTLLRNVVLTALALCLLVLPAATVPALDAACAILAALVLTAIYAVLEKLSSHLPNIRQGDI
ncbi:MauE/DoxX family redox-associated membrane protein [Paracoccus sp. (in: a-proteobacteria)]|uniref:MauE/DoxX family redox-associated membrane protein n=1 Tax=Paracoccus sp. TaxID=267 RepID=UPI003A864184